MTGIKKLFKKESGFTIIETVVVIAVFLLVIGAGLSIFISIVVNQKKLLSEQKIINQISYTLEHMSKAMRMAKLTADNERTCISQNHMFILSRPNLSTGSYDSIKFVNQSNGGACTEFYLDTADGVLKEIINNGYPTPLTSSDLKIKFIRFGINGKTGCYSGDYAKCPTAYHIGFDEQARVTVLIGVQMVSDPTGRVKILQTTISARNLNAKAQ